MKKDPGKEIPLAVDFQEDVPLAPLTTLGLGGPARYFAPVRSIEDILEARDFARRHSLRMFVLGGGSNTIFRDTGFDGLVIHMAIKGIAGLETPSPELMPELPGPNKCVNSAQRRIRIAAGENWDDFVSRSVLAGLAGIESLSGIPGQAGTVPVQNVGAYGQEVSSTIDSVECLDPDGSLIRLSAQECGFAYRWSRFKAGEPLIIVSVDFLLRKGNPDRPSYPELREAYDRSLQSSSEAGGSEPDASVQLKLLRECVLAIRRRKSMVVDPEDPDSRSVGSFFMNPVLDAVQYKAFLARLESIDPVLKAPAYPSGESTKISAAWLVEKAGFSRGYSENGVGVSKAHSLALVNQGGSAEALLSLAGRIEDTVHSRFGIVLKREPVLAG